jgi:hypothetical protein
VSQSTALAELKKLVIEQKKVFLPPEAEDPSLQELHDAVEGYDRMVSVGVITALQGQVTDLPDAEIRKTHAEITSLLAEPSVQSNRKADFYRSYQARLDRMLALIKEFGKP